MIVPAASILLVATIAHGLPINKKNLLSQLTGLLGFKQRLTFSNGNFKILSMSDFHLGERWGDQTWADWGPQHDAETQQNEGILMDQEHPDFVVFNGDFVSGENLFKHNATSYVDQVVGPAVQRNLKWASTYGNHDNSHNISHQDILEYEQKHYSQLSYSRSDVGQPPYGLGNYWLPVFEHEWDLVPALILWFFDSRSYVDGHGDGPGVGNQATPDDAKHYWVDETVVPAYIEFQTGLMKLVWGQVPPSAVFVHIPFHRLDPAFPDAVGPKDDEPNPDTQGTLNTYTGKDELTFQQLVNLDQGRGRVLFVVSGHDHGNNFCARTTETSHIPLCFQGHTGRGGYQTANTMTRNGRVFNFDVNQLKQTHPAVDTWSSFVDGTTNFKFTLDKNFMASDN